MSTVFVIKNQHGHYLSKQQLWLDGSDRRLLYRTPHNDEAVNVVFEQSSKDIYLRAEPFPCELDKNNQPMVEVGPPTALETQAALNQEPEQEENLQQENPENIDDQA